MNILLHYSDDGGSSYIHTYIELVSRKLRCKTNDGVPSTTVKWWPKKKNVHIWNYWSCVNWICPPQQSIDSIIYLQYAPRWIEAVVCRDLPVIRTPSWLSSPRTIRPCSEHCDKEIGNDPSSYAPLNQGPVFHIVFLSCGLHYTLRFVHNLQHVNIKGWLLQ